MYCIPIYPSPNLSLLQIELVTALDEGKVSEKDEPKARTRVLNEQYGWDPTDARKIWAFGPVAARDTGAPTNLLVDETRVSIPSYPGIPI